MYVKGLWYGWPYLSVYETCEPEHSDQNIAGRNNQYEYVLIAPIYLFNYTAKCPKALL